MTKTQSTDAPRRPFIPWVSVVAIGMAALTACLSLLYASEAIRHAASNYLNTYQFRDIEVRSSLPLDEDDLAALRALDGVKQAEPVWAAEALLLSGKGKTGVTVQALTEEISLPELLEGSLPAAGECAVEQHLQMTLGLKVGDRVQTELPAGSSPLRGAEYTVTGVFRHPDHISFETDETPYLLVARDSFDQAALNGSFTKILLRVEGASADRYAKAYREAVKPVLEAVTALSAERTRLAAEKAYNRHLDEERAKLEEELKQLRESRKKLEQEQQKQLDNTVRQLEERSRQLAEGSRQLEENAQQLEKSARQLDGDEQALAARRKQLDGERAEMNALQKQLEAVKEQLEDENRVLLEQSYQFTGNASPSGDALTLYNQKLDLWYARGEEYLDSLARYEQDKERLEQSEREYGERRAEHENDKAAYEQDVAALEQGKAAHEQDMTELAEARGAYEAEKAALEKDSAAFEVSLQELREGWEPTVLPISCRWLVLDSSGNAGYVFAETQAESLSSLCVSSSPVFLAVAALAICAIFGFMPTEQRALDGAFEASAHAGRETLIKAMLPGASAMLVATALATALSFAAVQPVILKRIGFLFTFPSIPPCLLPKETAAAAAGAAALVGAARPALSRVSAIRRAQEGAPLSDKEDLFTRPFFRLFRRDLPCGLLIMAGIAGCCLLLTAGFTLRNAIEPAPFRQFSRVIQHGAVLEFDPDAAGAAQAFSDLLEENGLAHVPVGRGRLVFRSGERLGSAAVMTAESGSLEGFYRLVDPRSGRALQLSDAGALIPIRMSVYYGLKAGDSLSVYNAALEGRAIPVSDVFLSYFGNLLVFTPEGYEAATGTALRPNAFLIRLGNTRLEELEGRLSGTAGFRRLVDARADRVRFDRLAAPQKLLSLLLLGLALVMTVLTITSLFLLYFRQRANERAAMRFSAGERAACASLVFAAATLPGIPAGLVGGHYLGEALLSAAEGPTMYFVHTPDPLSYVFAAVITAGCALLAGGAALIGLKTLSFTENRKEAAA